MTTRRILVCAVTALVAGGGTAVAGPAPRFSVEVLVDGRPLPVHHWQGVSYVEAVKEREYALRIRNPLGVRVAVALSVDGLNTIDARRTTAHEARKWVIGPYETVTISGWQTSREHARRFYFTSEAQSYGRALGQADNLGIISAAFFRERVPVAVPITRGQGRPGEAKHEARAGNEPMPEGGAAGSDRSGSAKPAAPSSAAGEAAPVPHAEDYAATGIGRRTDHRVEQVYLDLEPSPVATVDVRYEYRPQLVRLGALPSSADAEERRARARGFEPGFCPDPPRR